MNDKIVLAEKIIMNFSENKELESYNRNELIYKDEVYEIVGACMEIHRLLGRGFSEADYKDALLYEFKLRNKIVEREKPFEIVYKDIVLPHYYFADFVFENKIILEVKAQREIIELSYKQTLNYLAASKLKLGVILNFGEDSFKFKRVVLN